MTADEVIATLGLRPHPKEGGFFRETYRSEEAIAGAALPPRYDGPRAFSTAIYYLLTPEACSPLHRLRSDEVFHFYLGDPVVMLQLWPEGEGEVVILGPRIDQGQRVQVVVPRGVWQGCCLAEGGRFALLGTTVAPGFEYRDYEPGAREELLRQYPQFAELIYKLTP